MNAIDRAGTFRGKVVDHGVSETKNGFPQWVAQIQALEYYDEEKGEYTNWADYDQGMTAYLVLYTPDQQSANGWKELLNAKQLKKVFGWPGKDFESLANLKMDETLILFRVEDHEYNGVKSLQVSWIDTADANPVKQLPKFDASKLQGLTAKLGGALQGTVPATAPVKAPTSAKAKAPPKAGKKAMAPATNPTPAPVATGAAASSAPATPPPAQPETKDSAWASVSELKQKDVTDEKLAEVWIAEATKIGKAEDAFTSADWLTVKNAVLAQVSVF